MHIAHGTHADTQQQLYFHVIDIEIRKLRRHNSLTIK